jgi:pimeloyl-ACP methyl ester carboxylesterase
MNVVTALLRTVPFPYARGRFHVARRAFVVAAAFAAAAAMPGLARAAGFVPCHGSSGVLCATLTAPLDYSGAVPGQVSLSVEELPAGRPRGVMFLVAGGPGEASAKVFGLAENGFWLQRLFPGYTLVAYDDRGTGASGPLSCPGLFAPGREDYGADEIARLIGVCGDSVGPDRAFYATRDNAEDMETVRLALGVDRIAIWGTSYGTKQALAYALAHPDHVERLVLDSVLPPEEPDPFGGTILRNLPLALASLCHGSLCRSATTDPVGDVVRLANRLAVTPLVAKVTMPGSGAISLRLDGVNFLGLVVDSDLNPGVVSELPAAVSAALAGRPAPLERLAVFDSFGLSEPEGDYDWALNVATTCDDGLFPWQPGTAVADRQAAVDAALAALPVGTTGPFGSWATGFGTWQPCEAWPTPAGRAPLASNPLPDVPVLVVSGDRDMRTPTADARAVAARFPHAQLLVVPGVGHSVITHDVSQCAFNTVRAWLLDGKAPGTCQRVAPLMPMLAAFPRSVGSTTPARGVAGLRGRTMTVVRRTLAEAEAAWLSANGSPVAGVYGGRLNVLGDTFKFRGYSDVPGLAVTGTLQRFAGVGSIIGPLWGKITVSGTRAAHGTLDVSGAGLSGTLAQKKVSG